MRVNPRKQLARRGWLDDVVISAGGERFDLAAFAIVGGKNHQRQLRHRWLGAQQTAKRETVDFGQRNVDHHQVAHLFVQQTQRRGGVGHTDGAMPGAFENAAQTFARRSIVIDD